MAMQDQKKILHFFLFKKLHYYYHNKISTFSLSFFAFSMTTDWLIFIFIQARFR